jgi:hypothetical protein
VTIKEDLCIDKNKIKINMAATLLLHTIFSRSFVFVFSMSNKCATRYINLQVKLQFVLVLGEKKKFTYAGILLFSVLLCDYNPLTALVNFLAFSVIELPARLGHFLEQCNTRWNKKHISW